MEAKFCYVRTTPLSHLSISVHTRHLFILFVLIQTLGVKYTLATRS